MKNLYKQEFHHFDSLYPTSKAHEIQVIRIVSAVERMSTLFPKMSQKFSNLLQTKFMFIYGNIIFWGFFDLKSPK